MIERSGGWRIQWDKANELTASNREELEEVIDRLARKAQDQPFVVDIVSASGRSVAIALGRDESVIQYQDTDDPPYYASVGPDARPGVVLFQYGGEPTEFDRRNLVPIDDARRAVREFAGRDSRPTTLKWEET